MRFTSKTAKGLPAQQSSSERGECAEGKADAVDVAVPRRNRGLFVDETFLNAVNVGIAVRLGYQRFILSELSIYQVVHWRTSRWLDLGIDIMGTRQRCCGFLLCWTARAIVSRCNPMVHRIEIVKQHLDARTPRICCLHQAKR